MKKLVLMHLLVTLAAIPVSAQYPTQAGPSNSVTYGTTSGTAAAGNDSRIVNAIQPTSISNYGGINCFGDSLTFGAGSTTGALMGPTAKSTCAILNSDFGGGGQNYGKGSDQAADMSQHVYAAINPMVSRNLISTMMIGTNDVNIYGANANQEDTYTKSLLFSAAWAAIPEIAKVYADNLTACPETGAWQTDAGYAHARYTTVNGAAKTCTLTTYGSTVYVGYRKSDGTGAGTASVTVDGSACSESSLTFAGIGGSTIATANGSPVALALARCTGVAAGSHAVTVTATSGAGSVVDLLWVGSAYTAVAGTVAPPLVLVRGVPYQQHDTLASTTAAYDTLAQSVVTTLAGDGLNVKFSNIRAFMNYTTDFDGGAVGNKVCPASVFSITLHYGDCGHDHIAQADEAILAPVLKAQGLAAPYFGYAVPTTGFSDNTTRKAMTMNGDPRDTYRAGVLWDGTNTILEAPTGGDVVLRRAGSTTNAPICTYDGTTATNCPSAGGVGANVIINNPTGNQVITQPAASKFNIIGPTVGSALVGIGIGSATPRTALDVIGNNGAGSAVSVQNMQGTSSIDFDDNTGALAASTGCGNSTSGYEPSKCYFIAIGKPLDIGGGSAYSAQASATGFRITTTVPATSSATCVGQEIASDANYVYVCTATNTWKRAALSTF